MRLKIRPWSSKKQIRNISSIVITIPPWTLSGKESGLSPQYIQHHNAFFHLGVNNNHLRLLLKVP